MVYPGQTTQVVVSNKPNTAQVNVAKLDNNTGKIITKESTTFAIYEWNTSSNTWVKPTHMNESTINGTASDGKGAILKEKTVGTKGTYTTTMYYNVKNQGKFRIVEYTRPYGYTTSNWAKEIQITQDGQIFSYLSEVKNTQVRGQVNFKKNDKEVNYKNESYTESFAQGDASLQGALYGLYARENIVSPDDGSVLYQAGQQVETKTTNSNGKITWENLHLGKYYVQEITPSIGYLKDTTQYEIDLQSYYNTNYFNQGNQTAQTIVYRNTGTDPQYDNTEQRVISKETIKKQSFQLTKLSLTDESTMADPLEGAGFKIYLIKELSKVKDGTIVPDANGNYNPEEFRTIDFTKEQTALSFTNNANGERIPELFSNEDGILVSPELAYGKYVIVESTTPSNVKTIHPFIVEIQEDSRTTKKMVYPIDREFEARIKIIKKDDTTGEKVLKANASYRIWDVSHNQYVEQWVTYPNKVQYGTEKNPYTTTDQGYLLTPEVLTPGEYDLIEVAAPDGYVLAGREENPKTNIRFTISTNNIYEIDPDLGTRNAIITVEQGNSPQVGTITVEKQGEFLSEAQQREEGYQFEYTKRAVTDAKFAIYAKEDIYTQDNQGTIIYQEDQLIKEVGTNTEGKAIFEKLPLGKYTIVETKAGEGFILNTERKEVELTYEGQEKAVVYKDAQYTNERQKIGIQITKKDRETGSALQGAEFGLYTKEDFYYTDNSGSNRTIAANQLVAKTTSNEDGVATFEDANLPLGKYYIKEQKAPKGYATNPEIVDVDCTYVGQDTEKIEKVMDFTNQITKLKIKVTDHETGVNLKTTQILLKDDQGNIVGSYSIDENGEIEVKGLEIGKQYAIEEEKQRDNYVKDLLFTNDVTDPNELIKGKDSNGSVTFTIKDSELSQKVSLSNIAKVGQLEIEKTGEVLVGTEQGENGNLIFKYETQKIDTAVFQIYVKEDIAHPDGEQGIIITKGTKIGEAQTKNGILAITKISSELIAMQPDVVQLLLNRGLPLGTYEIKEIQAPEGYYFEEQTKTIRVEAQEDNTQIEKYIATINNERQSTNIGRPAPSIKIEKKAEKEIYQAGEQIIYTITVSNTGNTVIKDIRINEAMINGEFDETQNATKIDSNTIVLEKLEAGEIRTFLYRYHLTEESKGKIDNKVTIIGTPVKIITTPEGEEKEEPLEAVTDDAKEEVWVDQFIQKTANKKTYKAGDVVEYTLTIMNPYDEEIENATIEDEKVLEGSIIKTSKEGITAEDGKIIIGSMQAREKIEIVYQYKIPENYAENTLINTAKLKGTIHKKPITSEEVTTTVDVKKSGIEITKEAEKEIYQKGEIVNYTIKVSNVGSTLLKDVTIKENLLNGKFKGKVGIVLLDDQTVKIEELKIGQSIELTYQYTVENEKLIGEKIQNKVVATGKGTIENPEDPEHPTIEEVEDEAEKEIVIKHKEANESTQLGVYKTDEETKEAIKGAVFGLYTAEDIVDANNKVLVAEDTLIERATTNQEGYARFIADLPLGKYYILEMKPATGYIQNNAKIEIDATTISPSEEQIPIKLEVQNKKTEINIEKVEKKETIEDNRVQITGAILQILEEDGKVVKEWTTEEEPHTIKGLETNKKYRLHEAKPAKGYVTAKDIEFSIHLDGSLEIDNSYKVENTEIPTIIMQDEITKIKITIIDKETKEPIKDVIVQIVDKETGEVVYEFTTDGEEKIIEKIPIGDYEIREKDYPKDNGYVSIETEEFTVQDTPELQEKVIEQDYTKLDVSFIDEITKNLLPGGKLEIRKEDGEPVITIDDTGIHTYLERLPVGNYTIVEVEVPEGYEPLQEVKFTLKDTSEIQYVVIENKRLPFDLQVEKYASEVSVNGIKKSGANKINQLVKIEVDGKKIASQNVEIVYTIKVTNIGEVAGSVGEIIDKIPFGLTFHADKNETYWKVSGNKITTTAFADKKIQPKESIELKIVLDWTKSEFNLGEKENVVTIGGFTNNPGFADKDESNNVSKASVLLAVKTGIETILTKQTIAVILLELAIIGFIVTIEIVFIKKKDKK